MAKNHNECCIGNMSAKLFPVLYLLLSMETLMGTPQEDTHRQMSHPTFPQEVNLATMISTIAREKNVTLTELFMNKLKNEKQCNEILKSLKMLLKTPKLKEAFTLAILIEDNVLKPENVSQRCVLEVWKFFYDFYILLAEKLMESFLQTGRGNDFIGTEMYLEYTKRQVWINLIMTKAMNALWYSKVSPSRILDSLDIVNAFDTRVVGYSILLDLVLREKQNHETVLLQFANGIQNMTMKAQGNKEKLVILTDMRRSLPLTAQNIVFESNICVLIDHKTSYGKGLNTPQNSLPDKYRRPLTLNRFYEEPGGQWTFERVENPNKYRIVNTATGEYLYASVLKSNQDERKLYTWKSKRKPPTSVFDVEVHGDNVKLRNVAYNEYVLARGGEVFTWTPGGEEAYSYVYTKGKRRNVPWRPGTSQWQVVQCKPMNYTSTNLP